MKGCETIDAWMVIAVLEFVLLCVLIPIFICEFNGVKKRAEMLSNRLRRVKKELEL